MILDGLLLLALLYLLAAPLALLHVLVVPEGYLRGLRLLRTIRSASAGTAMMPRMASATMISVVLPFLTALIG